MKKQLSLLSIITITLLLVMLMYAPVASPAKAAGAQKWQFKTDNYTSGDPADDLKDHACNKQMSGQSGWPTGPATNVEVASNERAWWYSDVAAEENISFGEYTWEAEAHVFIDGDEEQKTVTVKSWKVASDGTATELATGSWTGPVNTTNTHHQMTLTPPPEVSQDIPVGWRIACSVEWSGGTANLKIGYNNTMGQDDDSWCQTPSADPGYPVPELSTLVLMSAGLAAIIAVLVIRHRLAKAHCRN